MDTGSSISPGGAIGGAIVTIGFFTLGGLLVPQVGTLGGVALGGFTAILIIPMVPAAACSGGVLGGVLGTAASGCRKSKGTDVLAMVFAVIAAIGSIFLTIYCAHLICSQISTLPTFTYVHALTVFGHSIWMNAALAVALLPCVICVAVAAGSSGSGSSGFNQFA